MKTFKKIGLGLGTLFVIAMFMAVMLRSSSVAYAACGAGETCGKGTTGGGVVYNATWIDRSDIKLTGSDGSSSTLTDSNWDDNWDFTGTIDGNCTVEINGFQGDTGTYLGYQPGWGASKSVANISIERLVNTSCVTNSAPGFKETDHKFPIGSPANAQIAFTWVDAGTIQRIDSPDSWTFSNPKKQSDGSTWFYRTSESSSSKCVDVISVQPGNSQMKLYEQNASDPGTGAKSPIDSNCWLESVIGNISPADASLDSEAQSVPSNFSMVLAGQGNVSKPAGTGAPAGGAAGSGGDASSSCDANFNSAFSWAVCPMLSFADGAIGFFYGQVEGQLCFNTGASSTAGDFSCGKAKDTSLADGVKSAWSIFKNIASALLVIVMLIMVISQAIGGGPFDAYTIRKMLPKLVAAVIIMQLSWILLKFAIDLSNDAGATIGNLMMAPFGGPSHMDLGSMLGKAVNIATGSQPGQVTFDVFASIAGVALFVWAIPALPLLALYVFVGAFIAFFTLILRKLLIIMLVILAPLAFIAWLLPGTEKYWKLWSDNFSKILIMFPLIMAMLSAGRIFAYITSLSGNAATMFNPHLALAHVGFLPIPYVASATGFVDIVIVIVAFFAPYFFLPKTYTWGGQLMGQVGKAVENYTNKGAEPAKKLLKEREESYRAERRRKSAIRVSKKEGFNILKPWQKPVDSLRSGQWDPTLGLPGSRRRQSAVTKYVAQGAEAEQQEVKEADLRLDVLFQQVDDHDGLARAYANGGKDENGNDYTYTTHDGRTHKLGRVSEAEMQAGLNAVAKFGGGSNFRFLDRRIAEMREGNNPEHKKVAKSFLDANASALTTKMKHLYYGEDRDIAVRAMVGSMSEDSFAGMEGAEMEAIIESLSQRIANGDTGAATQLERVLTFYQAALNNDNIHISSGVNQAVKALSDPAILDKINVDLDTDKSSPTFGKPKGRKRFGHPGINPAAATAPSVAPLVSQLDARIDEFGNAEAPTSSVASAGGGGTVSGTRPLPGRGALIPNGEVNIDHNSPEGRVISADAADIDNYVQTQGGWQRLSDGDLMNIYHFRTGEHKARAAEQLRTRNLL